ncbi:YhcH/YjgK/YiaL family protein [Parachlamydia sp. AcF125]|uniref:YhcH/YjgK/YiaL family protein n=1 Tax=Parachlamydia sp. AcF125 TaxID=2795736 RepID=UPI001BC8CEFE|nr:YhcH/YjgK/YiaL family protein [Parachlamydia sp. AcF125]MBS4169168.1 hypothetical protein [Parachlamydia sp. AcF125]
MIIDDLSHANRYLPIHPLFKEAFEFILRAHTQSLPPQKIYLKDERLIAIVEAREGRKRGEVPLEAHKKYIDMQYTLSGQEEIGWKWKGECQHFSEPYQDERDIMFFSDQPSLWIPMVKNKFVIFFPEDAHAPFVSNEHINKIIVKIAIE